jgi:predicted hydrocarbon binding protein
LEKVIPIQINLEKGELTLPATGLNVIIIPSEIFRELLLTSEEFLASGATVVWSFIGTAAGRKFGEIFRRECGIVEDEELVRCLSKYFTNFGWGKMSVSMFDPTHGEANIEVTDNLFTGKTDKPLCYFIQALISGMFEAIFQKPVECKEIKCVSQGDSCCAFEVRRRSE